jgi:hypothetical protein
MRYTRAVDNTPIRPSASSGACDGLEPLSALQVGAGKWHREEDGLRPPQILQYFLLENRSGQSTSLQLWT